MASGDSPQKKKEVRRQKSEDRMNAEGFILSSDFCLLYSFSKLPPSIECQHFIDSQAGFAGFVARRGIPDGQ
jgi:hypothetical protein